MIGEGVKMGTETINESSGGGFGGFGGWGGGVGLVGLIGIEGLLGRHRGEGENINLNTVIESRFNELENNQNFNNTRGELFAIDKNVSDQGYRNDIAIRDQTFHIAQGQEGIRAEVGSIGGRISRELLENRYLNAQEAGQTRIEIERGFEHLSRQSEKNKDEIVNTIKDKWLFDEREKTAELRAIITKQDNTIELQAIRSDMSRIAQSCLVAAKISPEPPIV
jgi:hypothetical protein